jgi:hypothetical protein
LVSRRERSPKFLNYRLTVIIYENIYCIIE